MKTVTVDILQDEAIDLLRGLDNLKIIKLHDDEKLSDLSVDNPIKKLKGPVIRQSYQEVEDQLKALRKEWD